MSLHRKSGKEDAVHTHDRMLPSPKNNEILPFATLWADPEGVLPSKISQRRTNTA